MDCETSLKTGRRRRNSDGLAPACVRRGEQKNGEVYHRYARGNAQPCRQAGQAGNQLTVGRYSREIFSRNQYFTGGGLLETRVSGEPFIVVRTLSPLFHSNLRF